MFVRFVLRLKIAMVATSTAVAVIILCDSYHSDVRCYLKYVSCVDPVFTPFSGTIIKLEYLSYFEGCVTLPMWLKCVLRQFRGNRKTEAVKVWFTLQPISWIQYRKDQTRIKRKRRACRLLAPGMFTGCQLMGGDKDTCTRLPNCQKMDVYFWACKYMHNAELNNYKWIIFRHAGICSTLDIDMRLLA